MRYLLKALLVVCLLAPIHPMLAQDQGKPVPVEKAAYHWPIFSNDYIMMLRVYMRPGKGSNFHIHSNDQISILVEAGANEGQIFGKAEKIPAKAGTRGSVGFTAFSKKTFIHRSTNTADGPFNNLVIALLKPGPGSFCPPDGRVITDFASMGNVKIIAFPSGRSSVYFDVSSLV